VLERAIGGEPVTRTVEGRERYTVNVRYKEDFRSSPEKMRQVLVPLPARAGDGETKHVPLGELADVKVVEGPPMLRDEAGLLVGYVYVDLEPWRDIGGYVTEAKAVVAKAQQNHELNLASGMYLKWTGQYELLESMRE